jgi:hypothetical protein
MVAALTMTSVGKAAFQMVTEIRRQFREIPGLRPDHSRLAMRSKRFRVNEQETVATALKERVSGIRTWWGKGAG